MQRLGAFGHCKDVITGERADWLYALEHIDGTGGNDGASPREAILKNTLIVQRKIHVRTTRTFQEAYSTGTVLYSMRGLLWVFGCQRRVPLGEAVCCGHWGSFGLAWHPVPRVRLALRFGPVRCRPPLCLTTVLVDESSTLRGPPSASRCGYCY